MERNERNHDRQQTTKQAENDRGRMVRVEPDHDRGLSGGLALGTTLLVSGLAVAFLAFGCGNQERASVATGEGTAATRGQVTEAAATKPAPRAMPATSGTAPSAGVAEQTPESGGADVQGLHMDTVSSDALPPEIDATVPDGLIAPGSVVDIRAQGSSDVVSMTLKDGRGKEQPFTRDEATGGWRTLYRAPLKATSEPVALSITAKNGTERWRRVWVFLSVGKEVAAADSSAE